MLMDIIYVDGIETGVRMMVTHHHPQLIKDPTRGNNCIDLMFTNSCDIASAGVWSINISDHDMIFVTKKKVCAKRKKVEFLGRSYRNYNRDLFQLRLRHFNWDNFWQLRDPSDCWDYILSRIQSELSVMCPLRSHRVRCSNEPWMNNGILEAIFDKDQAWKQAKKSGDMDDINRAKRLRNETKDKIRRAKRDFIQEELNNDLDSSKRFWKKVNLILPNRDSGNMIRLIDQEGGKQIDEIDTPDFINNFFTDIGPNLASKFDDVWVDDLPPFVRDALGDIHVDEQILEKVVKDINVNKASSVSHISAGVLKDAFLALFPQLVYMYNKSFENGIFPDSWKVANVIPLKKGGDPTDVSNLRPISLLPLPGKIAERLMHTHISNYVEQQGLLNTKQGGFRKGRSTISTVASLTDDILEGLNDRKFTTASFIDLKKAFDTINHKILLQKLPHFGLNLNLITWITSYLSNRKQQCTVNGVTSKVRPIVCGVPQGSILGPLLFLMFINDVDTNIVHSKVLLYADDTVIYACHKDESVAHLWMSEDLNVLCKWCQSNQLTINQKKTKIMLFGTRNMMRRGTQPDTFINGFKLQYVTHFNYLGIKLDNSLTFELHACETIRMVAHKLYLLSRIRKYINIQQAITIYRSMIVPYFDYGDIFLVNINLKSIDKMQKLQNRALRICLALEGRSNVNMLHNTCNINKLAHRRHAHLLNFAFTRAQDHNFLKEGNRNLRRYDAPVLLEPKSNNKYFERSLSFQCSVNWNVLPASERNIQTAKRFKWKQKCKLNEYFPYIN